MLSLCSSDFLRASGFGDLWPGSLFSPSTLSSSLHGSRNCCLLDYLCVSVLLTCQYFWKCHNAESIDKCSCYLSFYLKSFGLPSFLHLHPAKWFFVFPPALLPSPSSESREGICNLGFEWWGHSWSTQFGHSITCYCTPYKGARCCACIPLVFCCSSILCSLFPLLHGPANECSVLSVLTVAL